MLFRSSIGLSLLGIMLYVAFRFEIGYGIGAVVSTVHDVLMTIGIFVLTDRQFTAPMVGAILLIVGYSINDTIVVFDRIRENLARHAGAPFSDIVNHSVVQTLGRSLNTTVTVLMTLLALLVFAGGSIRVFVLALFVGILSGTYSSIFNASPLLVWWEERSQARAASREIGRAHV